MSRGIEHGLLGAARWLLVGAVAVACQGVLNPQPEDPGATSFMGGNEHGTGGMTTAGSGGGGPIFGIGGMPGSPTGSPPPTSRDASRDERIEDAAPGDAATDGGKADAGTDARSDARGVRD